MTAGPRRPAARAFPALLAAAIALGLAAGNDHLATAAPAEARIARVASIEATTPAPLRVTDAAGRVVELPAPPRRIVVAGHGPFMALDLLYLFPEARERLVGTERRGAAASDFLPLVDPDFARKAALWNPGPEAIAALEPDLVLIKSPSLDALGTALEQVHVPVVYLGLETPEEFFRDVANLGALLGDPARARLVTDFYRARLTRLRAARAAVPPANRPRVLLLEYNERGGKAAVRVPARAWMQTMDVDSAGGRPVWLENAAPASGWTVVNLEQIARWDPDQIHVVVAYTLDPAKVIADLKADPRWRALRAVRAGRLFAFPGDVYSWDTPDPRWILGMEWLATRVAPERFRDLDMAAEVRTFFGTLYGLSPDSIEARLLPRVHLDVR